MANRARSVRHAWRILSRRKKAAVAPKAFYANSADLIDARMHRRRQLPGELSFTDTAIHWNPSRYSIRKGADPITIEISERPDVVFQPTPGLAGLSIRIRRLDGSELRFSTHRTRKLSAAIERLDVLGTRVADEDPSAHPAAAP
jgi:hypothetical protein